MPELWWDVGLLVAFSPTVRARQCRARTGRRKSPEIRQTPGKRSLPGVLRSVSGICLVRRRRVLAANALGLGVELRMHGRALTWDRPMDGCRARRGFHGALGRACARRCETGEYPKGDVHWCLLVVEP